MRISLSMPNFNFAESLHKILAVTVFFVVAANQLTHIFFEGLDFGELLWFCDLMSFVLAYALWTKNRFLLSTVFLSSVPAQFMWIVDFFMNLYGSGFGRTDWMFEESYVWWTPYLSTLMHAILIPFSAWGIFRYGFEKRAILGVYFIVLALLPATYFFTDPTINRNCVFFPCDLNFIDDANIIRSNDFYMSSAYLFKEMFTWLIYTSVFYVFVLFVRILYYKFIRSLNKN